MYLRKEIKMSSALTSSNAFIIYIILLSIFCAAGIALIVIFELKYSSIIKNEGALCPAANCKYSSVNCDYAPFQYDEKSSTGVTCSPGPLVSAPVVSN